MIEVEIRISGCVPLKVQITNDESGTEGSGNYDVTGSGCGRVGRVEGFDRSRHVADLIQLALMSLGR